MEGKKGKERGKRKRKEKRNPMQLVKGLSLCPELMKPTRQNPRTVKISILSNYKANRGIRTQNQFIRTVFVIIETQDSGSI